jgi:histone H3/H4
MICKMGLVVKSNIRKHIELNVGEDLAMEMERKVDKMLKDAEDRAKANGRRTVYARDL